MDGIENGALPQGEMSMEVVAEQDGFKVKTGIVKAPGETCKGCTGDFNAGDRVWWFPGLSTVFHTTCIGAACADIAEWMEK